MSAKTRLGSFAVPLRAYGVMAPKTPNTAFPHNPGQVTRLGCFGVPLRAYALMLPKTPNAVAPSIGRRHGIARILAPGRLLTK